MVDKLRFDASEGSLEIVRQAVFRRLREDSHWTQIGAYDANAFDPYVEVPGHLRGRFLVLMNEIMWELIIQRVITPGSDSANPNLPFFRITDYGREVLRAERYLPRDPAGYISEVQAVARRYVRQVALTYLEEALRCFNRGCYTASVLLLGVASEAVFLDLCRVVERSIRNAADRAKFASLTRIRERHRWILSRYSALSSADRKRLPESLDVTLGALYDLIRRQRNDLGHPQDNPPAVTRDLAFVMFRLFPTFIGDVEAFGAYCRRRKL